MILAIARAVEDWRERKEAGELGEGGEDQEEEDIYAVKNDVEVKLCIIILYPDKLCADALKLRNKTCSLCLHSLVKTEANVG